MKQIFTTTALTALWTLTMTACGGVHSPASATAGAPHVISAICESKGGDSSFRIYEGQGLLTQYGKAAVKFHCEQIVGLEDEFLNSPAKMLWSCREVDRPQGLGVSVYKTGAIGEIRASVSESKGANEIALLTCQN